MLGDGPIGVVFSNQSNRDLCSWLPFAIEVSSAGFTVLLYDYSGFVPRSANLTEAVAELRRRGISQIALVGASVGANESLGGATELDPPVVGVVSLSAEEARNIDLLEVPVLFLASEQEASWTRALYDAAGSQRKQVELIVGDDHGSDLLTGPAGERVQRRILEFLRSAT